MSDPEKSRQRRKWHERLRVTLWTLIVPPTAWAAHFLFSYLWAAISCAKTGSFAKFPVLFLAGTLLALIVILIRTAPRSTACASLPRQRCCWPD